jgi:hypothetical protein
MKINKDIYNDELITYVPFLPISKKHVKQCIELCWKMNYADYIYIEDEIENMADKLDYEPSELKYYSTSGCKRVPRLMRDFFSNL